MPDHDAPVAEVPLDAEEVAERSFPTAFRGFDPVEVRAFLGQVADEVRRLREQEVELRRRLEELEGRTPEGDAAELLAAAQAEADKLVREARERVASLGSAATAEATKLLEEARAQAEGIRAGATDDLRARAEQAEAVAVRRIAEAEREAATIRVTARAEADELIEGARQRGREMVAEAQAARERMLANLAKRKRAGQASLEQMKVQRDRLLETLKVARRTIDEVTTRFEIQEGAVPSGTASAAVTTTPGAPAAQARTRPMAPAAGAPAAEQREGERRTPPRAHGVSIGEAPVPPARPQIAAPHAGAMAETLPEPPPEPATAFRERPAQPASRAGERRSSALRILRRHREPDPSVAQDAPHLVGRDSSAEGVRIIRGDREPSCAPQERDSQGPPASASYPPPSEPAALPAEPTDQLLDALAEDDEVDAMGAAAWPDLEQLAAAEAAEAADIDQAGEVAAARATSDPEPPDVAVEMPVDDEPEDGSLPADPPHRDADPEPPPPLVREEIRPRIEHLFARLRADRQAAKAPVTGTGSESGVPSASVAGAQVEAPSARPGISMVVAADRDEHLLQRRDAVIEPLTGQLAKRIKRALQDEQNNSLDRLRTSRGQAQLEGLLPSPDEQAQPYRRVAEGFLEDAARAGASVSPHGPLPVSVDELAAHLAADIAGGLRLKVRQVLEAAAGEGLDLAALSERISSVYREWKTQRVERLASHYLIAAHERGSFAALPQGSRLRWIVDDDGPCPDCDDNALAGEVVRGEEFPTGQAHPPAHIGCRCLLVPAST